jgi:hypothetical protein
MARRPLRLRDSHALRRRGPVRDVRTRFLLVCEGDVTEPGYFHDWRTELRTTLVDIEIAREHGVPKSLVEAAAAAQRNARRAAARQQDDSLSYDQVWCVFDIDEHPRIADAVDQANANGVLLAISNPSFELWALLHFQDQTAYLDRHEARRLLKGQLPDYDKKLPANLLPRYEDARRRACWLADDHQRAGSSRMDNPSSSVWILVDALREAAARGTR